MYYNLLLITQNKHITSHSDFNHIGWRGNLWKIDQQSTQSPSLSAHLQALLMILAVW